MSSPPPPYMVEAAPVLGTNVVWCDHVLESVGLRKTYAAPAVVARVALPGSPISASLSLPPLSIERRAPNLPFVTGDGELMLWRCVKLEPSQLYAYTRPAADTF